MPYCTDEEVKILIETSLEGHEIETLIALADADLDRMLGGTSMETSLKKKCSMMLSAAMISDKEPGSYSVGGVRIDQSKRAENWRSQVREIVASAKAGRAVIKSSKYQHIDESTRYSV